MKLEIELEEGRTITLNDRNVIVCGNYLTEIDTVDKIVKEVEKAGLPIYPVRNYYKLREIAAGYCPNLPRLDSPGEYMPDPIPDSEAPKGVAVAYSHNFDGEFGRVALMSLQLLAASWGCILVLATLRTHDRYGQHMQDVLDTASFYTADLTPLAGEVAA